MSAHNLSVALASQVGIEISICTKSYAALASERTSIEELASGLLMGYGRQQAMVNTLKTNDPKMMQCLQAYKNELAKNI